jgi:hypothetical protein
MADIMRQSCVTFVERDSRIPEHKNYLHFNVDGGCWSMIGRMGMLVAFLFQN